MSIWDTKGLPHKGWEPIDIADFGDDYQHCDMCNNYPVRWVHRMYHPTANKVIDVGCICAEKLCADYDGKGYERDFKKYKRLTERKRSNQRRNNMALVTPDLSEGQKSLEPGVYPARIIEAELKQSRAGKPMIKWALETFGADDQAMNGKRVYTHTMCEGKGVFKLQEIYKAATGEKLNGAFDTDQLVGSEVRVTLVEGRDQHGNPSEWPDVKTVSAYN